MIKQGDKVFFAKASNGPLGVFVVEQILAHDTTKAFVTPENDSSDKYLCSLSDLVLLESTATVGAEYSNRWVKPLVNPPIIGE